MMSQAHVTTLSEGPFHRDEATIRDDDPARGLANGLLLALPLWTLIGAVAWALI